MKNIHILPTEQSDLWFYKGIKENLLTGLTVDRSNDIDPQHVYITSNDTIQAGDWVISSFDDWTDTSPLKPVIGYVLEVHDDELDDQEDYYLIKDNTETSRWEKNCSLKIVFTTDPELIDAGVQSISDEFVNNIVTNSLTSIDVHKRFSDFTVDPFVGYEIVVPKHVTMHYREAQGFILNEFLPLISKRFEERWPDTFTKCQTHDKEVYETSNGSMYSYYNAIVNSIMSLPETPKYGRPETDRNDCSFVRIMYDDFAAVPVSEVPGWLMENVPIK